MSEDLKEFADYYPSESDLKKLREWPSSDLRGMLAWLRPRWKYSTPGGWCSWHETKRTLYLSTGGWSGNESLMTALEHSKCLFFAFCWKSARRGGHYEFDLVALNRVAPKPKKGSDGE